MSNKSENEMAIMDKNTYYEVIKNVTIEKVLNKYFSEQGLIRPALKTLLEDLLNCINIKFIFQKINDNDKGNDFYKPRNLKPRT